MRRREFIAGTAAAAALGFAQPIWAETNARSTGVKRLVVFYPGEITYKPGSKPTDAFWGELNRLGYFEGQNLIVERYSAHGEPDRIGDLARQIVASRPDVIMPQSAVFVAEIMALTTSIPMVAIMGNPIAYGFTTSLARPDRNFTGVVSDAGHEIWAKRVQLLLETARKVTKLGLFTVSPPIWDTGINGGFILEAAPRHGVAAAYVLVAGKFDRAAYERAFATVIVGGEKVDRTACEKAFEAMEKEGVDGLVVSDASELFAYRKLIADLATRFRVPAIYGYRECVEAGGLMAYHAELLDMLRRVAGMIGQVLRGAKPSDIPFYRATKYELVLNQKAATSLGLEFPTTLLAVADEVID
jgi:putative ABC transport system substrate-binding protein